MKGFTITQSKEGKRTVVPRNATADDFFALALLALEDSLYALKESLTNLYPEASDVKVRAAIYDRFVASVSAICNSFYPEGIEERNETICEG